MDWAYVKVYNLEDAILKDNCTKVSHFVRPAKVWYGQEHFRDGSVTPIIRKQIRLEDLVVDQSHS
jgi:hypothetical protein